MNARIQIGLFTYFLFSCSPKCDFVFNGNPVREFEKECISQKLDYLKMKFGFDKKIPKECELQAFIALSYYPELHSTTIEFVYSDINTSMATRPTITSSLRGQNRKYTIFIDNYVNDDNGILFNEVPFNAQIGLIGHELSHIVSYTEKNGSQLLSFGFNYINGQKSEIEKKTDRSTIQKGLAWQLYDWSDFALNKSKASNLYKDFKRQNYLTPEDIKKEIEKTQLYKM